MQNDDMLQAGIAAAKAGDLARANSLLAQVVRADPRSEEGWLWLGRSRTSPEQRAFCFNQVLAINPANLEARQELRGDSEAALPATPRSQLAVGVLWKPPQEPPPDLEPEAPPHPAADAQPAAPRTEPEEPPRPASLAQLIDVPTKPVKRREPTAAKPPLSVGVLWKPPQEPAPDLEPEAPPEISPTAAAEGPASTVGPEFRTDEPSEPEHQPAAPVSAEAPAESEPEISPLAPTGAAQPRPKAALNPLWLAAGLAVIVLACLAGLGLVWYSSSLGSALPNVTAMPTLPPTPAPATLTPSPQPAATSLFPTEWTKAAAEAGVSPTPRPSATTSAQKLATAQALVTQAGKQMKAGDYERAIDLLDQALVVAPRYGNAYYQRASAGNLLTQYEAVSVSRQPELYRYLANINQALALDPPSGNYYLVRFHLEETLALVSPYRVDQDFWHDQALADIRQANKLGNTEAYSERQPPFVLANLGRCQEAQDEVNQLFKTKPQPSGGLYSALAASDICLKDAESALKHIDAAINSQATSDRLISRVVILYSLGRWADARTQLDALLKAHPDICPCRYAWRALLDYKLGDWQMVQGDLLAAGKPIPPTEGVDAYIRGLLALQAGDRAGAVQLFQEAEAKLTRGDGPVLLEEIRQQLAQAGAAPLSPTVSAPPTPAPRP